MKKLFPIALISITAFFIASCDKDKRAEFILDKAEYIQGETIKTTNKTVKGSKYYRWDFNGKEIYEKEPVYVIPLDQAPGEFVISCEATNSKSSSSSGRSSSKTVMIKEAVEGKLVFWNPGSGSVSIKIRLTGGSIISYLQDTIRFSDSSNPLCNSSIDNAVFQKLKSGTYNYEATDLNSASFESGSITLDNGFDCKSVQIF